MSKNHGKRGRRGRGRPNRGSNSLDAAQSTSSPVPDQSAANQAPSQPQPPQTHPNPSRVPYPQASQQRQAEVPGNFSYHPFPPTEQSTTFGVASPYTHHVPNLPSHGHGTPGSYNQHSGSPHAQLPPPGHLVPSHPHQSPPQWSQAWPSWQYQLQPPHWFEDARDRQWPLPLQSQSRPSGQYDVPIPNQQQSMGSSQPVPHHPESLHPPLPTYLLSDNRQSHLWTNPFFQPHQGSFEEADPRRLPPSQPPMHRWGEYGGTESAPYAQSSGAVLRNEAPPFVPSLVGRTLNQSSGGTPSTPSHLRPTTRRGYGQRGVGTIQNRGPHRFNPTGTVPRLEDDGSQVSERHSILSFVSRSSYIRRMAAIRPLNPQANPPNAAEVRRRTNTRAMVYQLFRANSYVRGIATGAARHEDQYQAVAQRTSSQASSLPGNVNISRSEARALGIAMRFQLRSDLTRSVDRAASLIASRYTLQNSPESANHNMTEYRRFHYRYTQLSRPSPPQVDIQSLRERWLDPVILEFIQNRFCDKKTGRFRCVYALNFSPETMRYLAVLSNAIFNISFERWSSGQFVPQQVNIEELEHDIRTMLSALEEDERDPGLRSTLSSLWEEIFNMFRPEEPLDEDCEALRQALLLADEGTTPSNQAPDPIDEPVFELGDEDLPNLDFLRLSLFDNDIEYEQDPLGSLNTRPNPTVPPYAFDPGDFTIDWAMLPEAPDFGHLPYQHQPAAGPLFQHNDRPFGGPSRQPSGQAFAGPSRQYSDQPFAGPSRQPSGQAFAGPSRQYSDQPFAGPSRQPFDEPAAGLSRLPFNQPVAGSSRQSSNQPVAGPSRLNESQAAPTRQDHVLTLDWGDFADAWPEGFGHLLDPVDPPEEDEPSPASDESDAPPANNKGKGKMRMT